MKRLLKGGKEGNRKFRNRGGGEGEIVGGWEKMKVSFGDSVAENLNPADINFETWTRLRKKGRDTRQELGFQAGAHYLGGRRSQKLVKRGRFLWNQF